MTAASIDARAIQRALVLKGYKLEVDGDIGPISRDAIKSAVIAEVGAVAWHEDRLMIAFEQMILHDGGLYFGAIDGLAGPKTREALRLWGSRQIETAPPASEARVPAAGADWASIIRSICPKGRAEIIAGAAAAMPRAIEIASLTTPRRQSHYLSQIAHESDGFKTTVEYASGGAYEGRKDLGNTQRGDGVRFKGRGLIQLTGRANYMAYGFELGLDLVGKPELAAQFPAAALTAALYWRKRGINAKADRDDIEGVTRKINGGVNGLADRKSYLAIAKRVLAA